MSIESVDQLQPTHKELGKMLQHYKEVPSTHQPQLKVDTAKLSVLKDITVFQHRDFRVHWGQMGDQSSEITYSGIFKQTDVGIRLGFTEPDVFWGVLKVIKSNTFIDMLTNKEKITICELNTDVQKRTSTKARLFLQTENNTGI